MKSEPNTKLSAALTWASHALPLVRRAAPMDALGQAGHPTARGFASRALTGEGVVRVRAALNPEQDWSPTESALDCLRVAVGLVNETTAALSAGRNGEARSKASAALWRIVDGIGLAEEVASEAEAPGDDL